jgi:ElaA protein
MTDLFFEVKLFRELNSTELYKILQLRSQVFVVEQNCVYQDLDDKDLQSHHVICYYKNELVAYARCCPPNLSYKDASSIGRVVINPLHRGKKRAYALMNKCIDICRKKYQSQSIIISAQLYLKSFYEKCGFNIISDVYEEDGIPHIKMELENNF